MSDVHTDMDTVKRLAAVLEKGGVWSTGMQLAATTLLALLAERDVERANAETLDAANLALQAERDRLAAEVTSLRLTLGGKTFSADVPEPIGCPLPGACATVAEIVRLRGALTLISDAAPDGWHLNGVFVGQEARDALAGEGRGDDLLKKRDAAVAKGTTAMINDIKSRGEGWP